ncbi:MAG TPA: double-strand break repair protein AddB, partial [Paracoccus sp. (in: a-proteobacteria)]|nr:double-strand break repair protein AddB [Paracoccus sp. (in: a-proteobacteria)]
RQWAAAERLAADWAAGRNLPEGPVIVAGSTGSHGASRRFMQAVAALPCGAVILPGFDFDMPDGLWASLRHCNGDHPQARFAPLIETLGMPQRWTAAQAPVPARNRLVSLALRPPPVTDQWIAEGPALGPLGPPTERLTLVEAEQPGQEANAIAVLIRSAVEQGTPVTLIASDRTLTRRVTAALDRWRILPDDSAGTPLPLTAAGLFLRHVAALAGRPLGMDVLLGLLKHPVTASGAGAEARRQHLLHARELELHLRRNGPAFPDGAALRAWGARPRHAGGTPDPARQAWAQWLAGLLGATLPRIADGSPRPLSHRAADHRHLAELWATGPGGTVAESELYATQAGERARAVLDHLAEHAGRAPATT